MRGCGTAAPAHFFVFGQTPAKMPDEHPSAGRVPQRLISDFDTKNRLAAPRNDREASCGGNQITLRLLQSVKGLRFAIDLSDGADPDRRYSP